MTKLGCVVCYLCGAGHVLLHAAHGVAGLDVQAPRVVHDALAHQHHLGTDSHNTNDTTIREKM